MLAISRYVIHEVHKEFKVTGANVELSSKIPEIDDFAKQLIDETHKSFGNSSALKNTQFEEGHSTVFHTGLVKYMESGKETDFYDYTVKSLDDLKARITDEQFAVGGYYLFADYYFDGRRYISAVLLRKKAGLNFQKINNVILPVGGETLNIEKIAMGFRLNHGVYLSDDVDRNYIALVTNQKEKLSGYFKKWVQASGVISDDKNTASLVKIINSIDIPVDENNKPKYASREEMKRAYYDMIDQSPDKSVNMLSLSETFYGAEQKTYLLEYAQLNQLTIDPEFKRTAAILKKLITVRAKVEGIELNVNYDKLNPHDVDVRGDTITIRSQALVDQINLQKNEL